MEKRTVFLLGAGAAMPWNGPKTSELTDYICRIGFKNDKEKCITEEIFDWLKGNGFNANFETIINVIEDFIEFWSLGDTAQINGLSYFTDKHSPLWKKFIYFDEVQERRTTSFRIPGTTPKDYHHRIEVPEGEAPEKVFLENLLVGVIDSIIGKISEYSYYTSTKVDILDSEKNKEINNIAASYFAHSSSNNLLRIYTLNYDTILQFILRRAKIKFTDGFNDVPENFPQPYKHINTSGILRYNEKNCIYHLHGSAFWMVLSKDQYGLDYYSFAGSEIPELLSNNASAWIELEKGKKTLVSNLISGYRKVQRTGLAPFRQIFSAFDRDLHFGDELIIIGYSFGDEHINDIVRKAKSVNPNMVIKIVDPSFNLKSFISDFVLRWTYGLNDLENDEEDSKISFPHLNLIIYKMGFKEFMCHELATTNQPNNLL